MKNSQRIEGDIVENIEFSKVADLYDDYVNADFDLDFFRQLARKAKGDCLELMCGTGRVSVPLLKDGIRLTCVDYAEEMLQVLVRKTEGLESELDIICQDVCRLELGRRFKLIFIPFNSFSEITETDKQTEALLKIHDHLEDGGVFVCTLYHPAYRRKTADGMLRFVGSFKLPENRSLTVSYYNQYDEKTSLVSGRQFYEIYDEEDKMVFKRALDIKFSLIDRAVFLRMAEEAGFSAKEIYGDYDFSPFTEDSRFMIFLLVKK